MWEGKKRNATEIKPNVSLLNRNLFLDIYSSYSTYTMTFTRRLFSVAFVIQGFQTETV